MAITHFIPELWSASIMENFHNQTIVTGLANRQYEGQLTSGSKINIPGIVDIEVKDYKAAGRTTSPDDVSDTGIDMVADQEKSFDFKVDDIDRTQSRYSFDAYTTSAARGLAEDAEVALTATMVAGGTSVAGFANPTDWTTAWSIVQGLRKELTDAKVPLASRYLLVNSAFEQFLLGADSKLVTVDTSGSSAGLREATIGRVLGFNVITSPWLTEANPQAIGFYSPALAYVSQISEMEAMRSDTSFADRIRGLHVYGTKVLRPTAIQIFTAA